VCEKAILIAYTIAIVLVLAVEVVVVLLLRDLLLILVEGGYVWSWIP
jgi:hypothetical protein